MDCEMSGFIHKRFTFMLTYDLKTAIFKVTVPATLRAPRSTADQGGSSILYPNNFNVPIKKTIALAAVVEMI